MTSVKRFIQGLYTGYPYGKAGILLFVALVYLVLTAYGGGSVGEFLLFALVLAGYILLPGLLAADILRVEKMAQGYRVPLAILLGTGFFAALYCFSMRLHVLWLLRVVPLILSGIYIVWQVVKIRKAGFSRPKIQKPFFTPTQWLLLLLFAALLLLYTFASVIKNARPLEVGDVLLNHDLLWNVGNANSFKMAFPPEDIRFYNVRLHYHYLTELLAGALSLVSGIEAYNIIGFYMQPFVLMALVLCLYRFGRLLWPKGGYKPMLFTYGMFLFSCASLWKILPGGLSVFWNGNITHLITNINSQTTAIVYLCLFCGLFIEAARNKYRIGPAHFILTVCAFVMLCFAKGPLAALVIISLGLTLVIGLFQKNTTWRGLALGLVLGGLFLFIYFTMFSSGANTSMTFSPVTTLESGYFGNIIRYFWDTNYYIWCISIPVLWFVQSFLMMPAQFPLYLRGLARDVRHFGSLAPEKLLFNGVAAGGLLAYFLFYHPSMSQAYFLYAAIFFVTILAVDATDFLRGVSSSAMHKIFFGVVAFFAAVGFITTAFLYVNMMGSGARQLARNLGIIEKYPYDVVVTPEDEAAMLWLRENSPEDSMFATNRIHTGGRKEGISNLYSAFCERQGYMEGFSYAVTNMGVPEEEVQKRLAVNEALFSADTPPAEVVALCRENGIDYLIYSAQMDGADAQLTELERVFDAQSIRIYRVPT